MTEILVDNRQGATIHIPGLGDLTDDRAGDPATIRWASITPDGEVRVHTSDNRTAYGERIEERLQWRFMLDVFGVIDPLDRCTDHRFAVDDGYLEIHAGEIVDDVDGMFLCPCSHDDLTIWPENPAASVVLAGPHKYRKTVHGTVAWVGFADGDLMHQTLTDERLADLRSRIEQAWKEIR